MVASKAIGKPSVAAPSRNQLGLTNLQMRAVTIGTIGPAVIAFGVYSERCATALVFACTFIGGIEWSGLKRHLKVALLTAPEHPPAALPESASFSNSTPQSPSLDFVARPPPPSPFIDGVPLCPEEYALPVPPITFYTVLKHLGWSLLAIAAYNGEQVFLVAFELYFLLLVVVTLTAHNRLEVKVGHAMERLSQQFNISSPSASPHKLVGTDEPKPSFSLTQKSSKSEDRVARAQREYFLRMELQMIAERQPTEQFLDFCLDIFGLLWLVGVMVPLFMYHIPNVGIPWLASTLIGNFMNDIAALVVGRSLRTLRNHYGAMYNVTGEESTSATAGTGVKRPLADASPLLRLMLRGPHPLYQAISPNKSMEGAVAGVLMNSVSFAGLMWWFYRWVLGAPEVTVVNPVFQHVGVWLVVGLVMGVLGVVGDLLQSLLKRAARVKDAGFIIPGHGGVLDRIDGILLVFPFMYCALSTITMLSA